MTSSGGRAAGPPRRAAGSAAGPAARQSLLAALATKLAVDLAVYVRADAGPAVAIVDAEPGKARARAEELGRLWLAGMTGTSSSSLAKDDLVGTVLRSVSGGVLGVVVSHRQQPWTYHDRVLFDLELRSHAAELDPRAIDVATHTDDVWANLEETLRTAARDGGLRLMYQPEFDLRAGRVTAVEALVRWDHPTLGELGPESFISIAERSGLIKTVGAWVINEAMHAYAGWAEDGLNDGVVLRINVSPVQLADAAIAGQIADALAKHHVAGENVCIELTENEPLRDPHAVAESMQQLKKLGVLSAIDDLATGYSTLSNLRLLPFDVIKIDRSLVFGIDHDTRAELIVAAIIGLAHSFDVDVVAEGVENEAEANTLLRLGCTHAQGHLLARPMDADLIRKLLCERNHSNEAETS